MSIAQILIQPTTPDIIIVRHGDNDDNENNDSLAGSFNSEEAPSTAHTTPHKDTPMILNGRAGDRDEQEEEEGEDSSFASTTTSSNSNDAAQATTHKKKKSNQEVGVTLLPAPEEVKEEEEGKRSPTLMLDDADEAIQPSEGEISPNSVISEGNNTQRHHQASFSNNGSFPDVCGGGGCLSDNDTSMSAPVSPALVISQLPASARPPCRPHVTPADIEQQRAEIIRNRKASLDQWVAEHEDAATFAVPADIRILTLLREGHRHEQAMLDKRIQALEKAHEQEMNNQEQATEELNTTKKNELRRKVLRQSYKNIIIDAGKRLRNAAVSKKLAPPQVQKMASDGITCYSTMFPWNEGIHGDAIIQLEPALSSSRPGSAPASPACARPMGRAPPRNGANNNNSSNGTQPPRPATGTSSPPPQQPPRCTPLACLTLENRRAELAQRRRAERIREWAVGRQQQQQRTTGKK